MTDEEFEQNKTMKVSDFLLKSGMSLVPFGSSAYDLIKLMVDLGKEQHKHDQEKRLLEFHDAVFTGKSINQGFNDKKFDMADYTCVLNSCLQDIENEKAQIYGKLLQNFIIKDDITKEQKRRLISISKDLSLFDMNYLRKLYIIMNSNVEKYEVNNKNYFRSGNYEIKLSLNKLSNNLLIDIDNCLMTDVGNMLIKNIFDDSELTPTSIGVIPWKNITIQIVSYELTSSLHVNTATKIQNYLESKKIKNFITVIDRNNKNVWYLTSAAVLIYEHVLGKNVIEMLNEYCKHRNLYILDISGTQNEQIKEIKYKKSFNVLSSELTASKLEELYSKIDNSERKNI